MDPINIDEILIENGLTETELIFKSRVKELRLQSPGKPTISETASAIGIKYGTYRMIESMTTPVNVKFMTMEKIAKYYKIPVSHLFQL